MKRLILFLCLGLFLSFQHATHAQFNEPVISFEQLNHNFGQINEEGGMVDHIFTFKNTGSKALVINSVHSSCGCTIPVWPKEPIMPGATGDIKVTFNPINRPGAFRKSITVKSNARQSTTSLYIVGLVKAKPKTVADQYPIRMDGVRFKTNHISVTRIKKGESKTDTLFIMNDSDMDKKVTIQTPPPHLTFEIQPATLMPKQQGIIIVHFDSGKKDDWGFVMDKVFLSFNGVRYNNNLLAVSATIEENFSHLSEAELAKAAKMEFADESYNFGTIDQGKVVKHRFEFTNTGKTPLIIRKMTTTCGCTATEPSAYEIRGGESGYIDVEFNSTGKIGKQFQTVTLITNDPSKTSKLLRMIGTVSSKKK